MTVQRVSRRSGVVAFHCDGCGLAWRIRLSQAMPKGWRRLRAGAEQVDLCPSCLAIDVWHDDPKAVAIERWGAGLPTAQAEAAS